ncbi:hypothetical protein [Sphingomonas adhaesiva]|uniref:hypothetical protein n=1 Tax=Sphingomonas adhaesiva TaxID=28212 RepID=UPI002FF5DE9A
MTKERAPLTYEDAQARVAGRLGVKRAAEIAGVALRTWHDWGDPDSFRTVTLAAAEKLDLAYVEAGGESMPFLDTLNLRLKTARENRFGDQLALAETVAVFAKEAGEFTAAAVRASMPDAGPADAAALRREGNEAIAVAKSMVAAAEALERSCGAAAPGPDPPDTS